MSKRYGMRLFIGGLLIVAVLVGTFLFLAQEPVPERTTYGVSFNTPYVRELGLPPREVYDAILDELGVRHLRLAAHWTMTEPEEGRYDFTELDYQIAGARARGADVVLAVGRRLPRWPECHVPTWATTLSWEDQKEEIREYLKAVVERYRDEPHIVYWQVENEPYLAVFAHEHCGDLDEAFLHEEIALVRSLDGTRPILVTDSGNLGTWAGAWRAGDAFGTSVYVYFWNPELGPFRTVLPPAFYRVKKNLMALFYGTQHAMLIELSAEPWLIEPIVQVPLETQFERMDPEKFEEILEYARGTRFERQYLWGAEWWYWLKEQGHPAMWEKGQELFAR